VTPGDVQRAAREVFRDEHENMLIIKN